MKYDLINLCYDFANKQVDTSKELYVSRGQAKDKIIKNIFTGKLCEWHVYQRIKEKGYTCTPPDMEILAANKKSYAADLIANNKYHIHVKSCYKTKYQPSWVLQNNEPVVTNAQNYEWLALCMYENPDEIKLMKWLNAKSAIYKPTVLPNASKCAIYWQDVAGV
jgi:hypothetical protein